MIVSNQDRRADRFLELANGPAAQEAEFVSSTDEAGREAFDRVLAQQERDEIADADLKDSISDQDLEAQAEAAPPEQNSSGAVTERHEAPPELPPSSPCQHPVSRDGTVSAGGNSEFDAQKQDSFFHRRVVVRFADRVRVGENNDSAATPVNSDVSRSRVDHSMDECSLMPRHEPRVVVVSPPPSTMLQTRGAYVVSSASPVTADSSTDSSSSGAQQAAGVVRESRDPQLASSPPVSPIRQATQVFPVNHVAVGGASSIGVARVARGTQGHEDQLESISDAENSRSSTSVCADSATDRLGQANFDKILAANRVAVAETVDLDELVQAVVKARSEPGTQSATVRVFDGEVSLTVTLRGNDVIVVAEAASREVANSISESADELAEALARQGLNLSDLSSFGGDQQGRSGRAESQDWNDVAQGDVSPHGFLVVA